MKASIAWKMIGGMACLVLAGCSTPLMKPTPFYEGSASSYTEPIEDRVNLWPLVYHRAPATSVLWPMLSVSDDHFAFRPFYSQYKQTGAAGDYDEFSVLWPYCQIDARHGSGWAFPFYWAQDRFVAFPLFYTKENQSQHDFYAWALLSSAHWSERTDAYSWYALLGLVSAQANDRGIGQSWCFPIYYHRDNVEFTSWIYSWSEENGTRTTDWLTPLVATWSGVESGFRFWPFYEQKTHGTYDALEQDLAAERMPLGLEYENVLLTNAAKKVVTVRRPLPKSLGRSSGRTLGVVSWRSEINDKLKGAMRETYALSENSRASCPLAFMKEEERELMFDSEKKEKTGERWESSCNVLGFLYDSERKLDTVKKVDHTRTRIFHWLWNREEDKGNVSIDMLPGYTYDSKTNGYFKTSFLWRFFRYEEEPGQNPQIDFLYIPCWR